MLIVNSSNAEKHQKIKILLHIIQPQINHQYFRWISFHMFLSIEI